MERAGPDLSVVPKFPDAGRLQRPMNSPTPRLRLVGGTEAGRGVAAGVVPGKESREW